MPRQKGPWENGLNGEEELIAGELPCSDLVAVVGNPLPPENTPFAPAAVRCPLPIQNGREHLILKVRKSQFIPAGFDGVPQEILPHLELAGFTGIAHVCQFPLDLSLITALVERWRTETHTFHLPQGLRIDGRLLIAPIRGNYADIVEESLGIRPSRVDFVGSFLKTSWLDQHFTHVAMHAQNPVQIT
ncbi:uncharacterized protein LOC113870204 [Abrus precatorius]|uniref:Uncharacterized protein LOC113870204 n=1 Tax=Abrus precatorius TaxID=3816 RepID=A0A8B8M1R0_ABRPR|nr:uncharacterized protein LOC113870204 [Abrus precatorius]